MNVNTKFVIGLYRNGELTQLIQCPYIHYTAPIEQVKSEWVEYLTADGLISDDELKLETARSVLANVLDHRDDVEGLLHAEPMQKAVFVLQRCFRLSKIYYDSDNRQFGFE